MENCKSKLSHLVQLLKVLFSKFKNTNNLLIKINLKIRIWIRSFRKQKKKKINKNNNNYYKKNKNNKIINNYNNRNKIIYNFSNVKA